MSYNDLRNAVGTIQNVDLRNPGKIYFKDNYIFIVEELKGIHVFDNINPASPVKKTFIRLPGVNDISISGSTMYADSYVDLVVLDVEDVNNIHEVGRMADILPYTVPETANTKLPMAYIDKDRGVVIDWEQRTIKEKVNLNPPNILFTGITVESTAGSTRINLMLLEHHRVLAAVELEPADQWPGSALKIIFYIWLINQP